MKKNGLTFFLSLSLILLTASIGLADPGQILLARDAGGGVWFRTCRGTTCSGWTNTGGVVAMDPALVWDNDTAKYYLYGVVSNGTIWRATFDPDGTFNNDWVSAGGSSSSPIIGASGGRFDNIVSNLSSDMTPIILNDTTITNIKSIGIYCPSAGYVVILGTGSVKHVRSSATGGSWSRVYLSTTSGGTQVAWNVTDVPSGTPIGDSSFPFGISRWFSVTEGSHTFYMTGEEGGGAAATTVTEVFNPNLTAFFFAYSY